MARKITDKDLPMRVRGRGCRLGKSYVGVSNVLSVQILARW
jgi:hypothetical protein